MTTNDSTSSPFASTTPFARSTSDKWIAGVCGGIAASTGWDVNLVRALAVGAAIVSFGTAVLVYLAAAMLMPRN